MIKKTLVTIAAASMLALSFTGIASAHVTVKPAEAETAAFQTFTTSVPTEKDVPTVKVRVVVPDGLKYVTPNVKPGWTIETQKKGEGEDAAVSEITWSGGTVPAGQRDEFMFSAQLPVEPTTIQWKAYQTYEDGEEVSWDQAPSSKEKGGEESTPYSETKVVKELSATSQAPAAKPASDGKNTLAITLSVVSLIVSVIAFTRKH